MSIKSFTLVCFVALSIFTMSSCNTTPKSDVQTVTINKEFSIDLPLYMRVSNELNSDACLQYQDTMGFDSTAQYIIVIDQLKSDITKSFSEDSIYDKNALISKNYRVIELAMIQGKMITKSGPTIKKVKINNLDAEIVDFVSKPENMDTYIYYKVAFVEGIKKVYMVMAWTLEENKGSLEPKMDKMLNSFKLVK